MLVFLQEQCAKCTKYYSITSKAGVDKDKLFSAIPPHTIMTNPKRRAPCTHWVHGAFVSTPGAFGFEIRTAAVIMHVEKQMLDIETREYKWS